ncbi:TetR/AcrR family transcriptional regulator [Rathayibacter soli]|uniref:TetR/AcrR family transcriptional regulator n=1 Tax=Rathayibacter soli TaxID=3144168 RepID=UPI0027E4168D|nr:TetR/AcrR family transcriptional regulator [Glaciibacter superstes]
MQLHDLLPENDKKSNLLVRTEPVQGRSAARIDALLDAAAFVVDETGIDRLTTAMVSEHAEASIGTVYRYFPDRIALLQALRDRAEGRYRLAVVAEIRRAKPTNWWGAVECALVAFAQMYRTEPGFRIIRFTDVARAAAEPDPEARPDFFAERFGEILADEYGLPAGEELTFHLGIAVQIGDSLITQAFAVDPAGDERILAEAQAVVHSYLAGYYDGVPAAG